MTPPIVITQGRRCGDVDSDPHGTPITDLIAEGRRHWHDILRDLAIVLMCVIVTAVMTAGYLNSVDANGNTRTTLHELEDALSLGTKAQQAATTRAAIVQIQCDTRQAVVDSFRALAPNLHLHLPGTPGIPATPAVLALPGKPNTGIPAIPEIPGCPPINTP